MASTRIGDCGYALGTRTDLHSDGTAVWLESAVLGLRDPVGRVLPDGGILVTASAMSTRAAAYRARKDTPTGIGPMAGRALTYRGERRTDTDTGRDCPVWRLR